VSRLLQPIVAFREGWKDTITWFKVLLPPLPSPSLPSLPPPSPPPLPPPASPRMPPCPAPAFTRCHPGQLAARLPADAGRVQRQRGMPPALPLCLPFAVHHRVTSCRVSAGGTQRQNPGQNRHSSRQILVKSLATGGVMRVCKCVWRRGGSVPVVRVRRCGACQ
jgi:hypothetical protein